MDSTVLEPKFLMPVWGGGFLDIIAAVSVHLERRFLQTVCHLRYVCYSNNHTLFVMFNILLFLQCRYANTTLREVYVWIFRTGR